MARTPVPERVELASEFRYRKMPLNQKALVIVVSQSVRIIKRVVHNVLPFTPKTTQSAIRPAAYPQDIRIITLESCDLYLLQGKPLQLM